MLHKLQKIKITVSKIDRLPAMDLENSAVFFPETRGKTTQYVQVPEVHQGHLHSHIKI